MMNEPNAEDTRRQRSSDEKMERKQISDVTRDERNYRKENNIPLSPKTHPGYYHMEGGPKTPASGGRPAGGSDSLMHTMNPLKLADGGMLGRSPLARANPSQAGNACDYTGGPGVRSQQDYRK